MNFISYFFSDKIALATYHAGPVTREELPRAYQAVERLTQKIGIPMPKIYVIPTDSPNAFATGRNPQHASVAVTQGILNLLNDEELEGVLAHELGHVQQPRHPDQFGGCHHRRRDYLCWRNTVSRESSLAAWSAMSAAAEALGALLMLILAPIAAMLIQLAVSRSREYQADETGAHFTGNPYALASALAKLDAYSRRVPMAARPHGALSSFSRCWE